MAAVFQIYNLKRKIENELGSEIANKIVPEKYINGDGLTAKEKADNMNKVIDEIEKCLSSEQIKRIRRSTSCNLTRKQIEVFDKAKDENDKIDDMIKQINRGIAPSRIEVNEKNAIFLFNRTKCICRMFDKVENPKAKKTFCYCCAGNVEKIMSYIFDAKVDVEILETYLIGNINCVFECNKYELGRNLTIAST